MFKIRRWVITLVVIVGILSSLSVVSGAKIKISMSVWGMPWEDYLYTDVIIPKFEKENPNIRVKFNRYEDYWTKLVVLYAGGEAPDVMRDYLPYMGLHSDKGMMHPLKEFINGPDGIADMDDFNPLPFQTLEYLGDTFFLPTGINNMCVVSYNATLFDKAGISYPNYDWTLDDLEAAVKKLTGKGKYGLLWERSQYVLMTMIYKMGATTFDPEDPGRLTIDSPEGLKAIELLQKWIFDDKIVPKVGAGKVRTTSVQLFTSGRLAMLAHGGWLVPEIKRDAPNLHTGTTIFPRRNKNTDPGAIAGGCGYMMNKDTKHPKEAWKLLKALTSREGIMDYWQTLWVETPARYSVLSSPEFKFPRGLKGKISGIKDEEEYVRKLKWHRDAMENNWFELKTFASQYSYLLYSIMATAAEKTIGTQRGNPEAVLKEAVEEFSRQVEAAKK